MNHIWYRIGTFVPLKLARFPGFFSGPAVGSADHRAGEARLLLQKAVDRLHDCCDGECEGRGKPPGKHLEFPATAYRR
jgi:hypothetical protein